MKKGGDKETKRDEKRERKREKRGKVGGAGMGKIKKAEVKIQREKDRGGWRSGGVR